VPQRLGVRNGSVHLLSVGSRLLYHDEYQDEAVGQSDSRMDGAAAEDVQWAAMVVISWTWRR
jgi:hypothetical protein